MKAPHSIETRKAISISIKPNAEIYKTIALASLLLVFGLVIAIKTAAAYDQSISLQTYWWENRPEITNASQAYWWENKAEQAQLKTRAISYWWENATGTENTSQPYWWENSREQVNLKSIALI